jgi:hypothetical protein
MYNIHQQLFASDYPAICYQNFLNCFKQSVVKERSNWNPQSWILEQSELLDRRLKMSQHKMDNSRT